MLHSISLPYDISLELVHMTVQWGANEGTSGQPNGGRQLSLTSCLTSPTCLSEDAFRNPASRHHAFF